MGPFRTHRDRIVQGVNSSLVAVALIILVVIFAITSRPFLSADNIQTIFYSVAVIAILSIGQQFVIATSGIDLSVGAIAALTGVIAALLMPSYGLVVGILVALLLGAGVGLLNGLLTAFTKVPAFIVTLGTYSICTGAALIATNGVGLYNFPQSFVNFGADSFGVFPYLIIVTIVLGIAGQILLGTTRFGRSVYAIGSNYRAALLSGLPVRRNLVLVYVISGLLAAVAGLLLTSYVASALPSAGADYNLDSIAAVVIGGGSLFGGQGAVWTAMLGALLMSVLSNGTQLLGVSSYFQTVILGCVVIGAVFIDSFRKRSAV
jgi:ribose/xylose/arabinose/galactoside ABC-type transport system permease subunit